MKPTHFNFVILLCFATVHMCSGYKPLRGTQGNAVPRPIDPENPPPEHGKSVYDPDIYHKYTGIQFEDQIEEDETEKDTSPNLPSYPWRGGGHIPMPLDDPEALNATKEVEYLIGFRDCDEILYDSPDLFKDDSEDDEAEEEEVEADRAPRGAKTCKKKEYPDDDSETETCDEGEKEVPENTDDTRDAEEADVEVENEEQTSEPKKKCEACSGHQDANSFAWGGVGAVSVVGRDYLSVLAPGAAAVSDTSGGGDQPDDLYHPYSDDMYGKASHGDQESNSFALRRVGAIPVIGKDYLDNGVPPGATAAADPSGGGDQPDDHSYPYRDGMYGKASHRDQDSSSFALGGVGAASVAGRDYLDNVLALGDTDMSGGGDHPDENYYPYSDNLYGKGSHGNQDSSSFALGGVGAACVAGSNYLHVLAPGENAADDTFVGGDQSDEHNLPYSDDLYGDEDSSSFALSGVGAASVVGKDYLNNVMAPGETAAADASAGGDHADEHYYPYSDDMYGEAAGGGAEGAEAGADVVAILDGGSSSEPPGGAARRYVYRSGDEGDGEGDDEGDEAQLRRRLGAEGCRVCVPCCVLLAAAEADAPERRARAGECTPDDSERDHVGAECRSCHVRRRPPPLGVVLTCYQCATQQADRTCRLGHENVEHAHYRVSAKFFLTTETNDTGEVTATQHAGMLEAQSRQLPAQQMSARASGRGHTLSAPSFIDSDSKDLYPFEVDEQEATEAAPAGDEVLEEEAPKEPEEKENKKGNSKTKQKKKK